MKIRAQLLTDFVRRASLDGEIPFINLNFTEEGLHSRVKDLQGIALTDVFVPAINIEDYESIGELFIRDTTGLINYIKPFGETITISLVTDHIVKLFDDTREVYVVLGSEEILDNIFREEIPVYDTDAYVTIEKDVFSTAVKDYKYSTNNSMVISVDDGSISIETGDRNTSDYFVNKQEVFGEGTATVTVGGLFLSIYKVLGHSFRIDLKNDMPLKIREETDDFVFTCIIAPISG